MMPEVPPHPGLASATDHHAPAPDPEPGLLAYGDGPQIDDDRYAPAAGRPSLSDRIDDLIDRARPTLVWQQIVIPLVFALIIATAAVLQSGSGSEPLIISSPTGEAAAARSNGSSDNPDPAGMPQRGSSDDDGASGAVSATATGPTDPAAPAVISVTAGPSGGGEGSKHKATAGAKKARADDDRPTTTIIDAAVGSTLDRATVSSGPLPTASTVVRPSVFYLNCTMAWRAGAAPLLAGQPGYRSGLDADNDGIACEIAPEPPATTTPPAPATTAQPVVTEAATTTTRASTTSGSSSSTASSGSTTSAVTTTTARSTETTEPPTETSAPTTTTTEAVTTTEFSITTVRTTTTSTTTSTSTSTSTVLATTVTTATSTTAAPSTAASTTTTAATTATTAPTTTETAVAVATTSSIPVAGNGNRPPPRS